MKTIPRSNKKIRPKRPKTRVTSLEQLTQLVIEELIVAMPEQQLYAQNLRKKYGCKIEQMERVFKNLMFHKLVRSDTYQFGTEKPYVKPASTRTIFPHDWEVPKAPWAYERGWYSVAQYYQSEIIAGTPSWIMVSKRLRPVGDGLYCSVDHRQRLTHYGFCEKTQELEEIW